MSCTYVCMYYVEIVLTCQILNNCLFTSDNKAFVMLLNTLKLLVFKCLIILPVDITLYDVFPTHLPAVY